MKKNLDEEDWLSLLEQLRWGDKPICPYCGSKKSSAIKKEKRYHCNSCFTSYSVTVNTFLHKTRVKLSKWFFIINIYLNTPEQLSVRQFAKVTKLNKNTVHLMILKIETAKQDDDWLLQKMAEYMQFLES